MVSIRIATLEDLEAIIRIYNEAIVNTTATFDTKPKEVKEQTRWFKSHGTSYPIIVALKKDRIVGWAALSPWSDRSAYSGTAEISVYVEKEHRGLGIGKILVKTILQKGNASAFHTIIARIAENNRRSVCMFESVGFRHIGVMKEVGKKFGKLIDVYLMQKIYADQTQRTE